MAKRSSPNVPAPHRLRFTVSPGRVGFEIYSKIQRKSSTSTSKTNTQTAPQMGLQGREATLHGQAQEKPVHSSAPLLHIYLPLQHRPSGSFTDAAPINTQAVSPDALKPSQVSPPPILLHQTAATRKGEWAGKCVVFLCITSTINSSKIFR